MSRRRRAQEENDGVVGEPVDSAEQESIKPTQAIVVYYDNSKWSAAQLQDQVLGPAIATLASGPEV